jgi:GNAT superfamily N-acetyltransferase
MFTLRSLHDESDYWRIRQFLREVFLINQGRQHSWDVARLDYWRYHCLINMENLPLEHGGCLWETAEGRIAGALTFEGRGDAYLHVHPMLRTGELEEAMICEAEYRAASFQVTALRIWARAEDTARQAMLRGRGYTPGEWPEYQRRRPMELPVAEHAPAEGYIVRALGGPEELPARSWASWKGFHPDEPDEHYQGWEWYPTVQRCPLYRRDLDLVAVAPSGEIAAFCTVWFDDYCRVGVFEPVATHPDHLRRGLASAVMAEGLRRLRWYGATTAYVGSYSEPAGRLYAAMGFTEYDLNLPFEKKTGG